MAEGLIDGNVEAVDEPLIAANELSDSEADISGHTLVPTIPQRCFLNSVTMRYTPTLS
jgi:hypothetical protein